MVMASKRLGKGARQAKKSKVSAISGSTLDSDNKDSDRRVQDMS